MVTTTQPPAGKHLMKRLLGRELVKLALSPLLSWSREKSLQPGYSIILGVPWHLRHLLPVNLQFLAQADRTHLRQVHVVLDRAQPGELENLRAASREFESELPLKFQCYRGLSGWIVERVDVSTFYNSMNCVTALSEMTTTHAVLHDFDLFPTRSDYFERIYRQMVARGLHYCGVEYTRYDGLSDTDGVLGTWGLGMDVERLRRTHRPIDIFHSVRKVQDRWVMLDPFSASQLRPGTVRELVDASSDEDFCHVKNLCSSYLRLSTGRHVTLAWRLHYLWYLESLIGRDLDDLTRRMDRSQDGVLEVDGRVVGFAGTCVTCASVLRQELSRMDYFLYGTFRSQVKAYIDAFERFLQRSSTQVRKAA